MFRLYWFFRGCEMRLLILASFIVALANVSRAEEPPEFRELTEFGFVRDLATYHKRLSFRGTTAQQDVQWEKHCAGFSELSKPARIEFEATVKDVTYRNGFAAIHIDRKKPVSPTLQKAAGLSRARTIWQVKCSAEEARELAVGQGVVITANVVFVSKAALLAAYPDINDRPWAAYHQTIGESQTRQDLNGEWSMISFQLGTKQKTFDWDWQRDIKKGVRGGRETKGENK